MVAPEGIMAAVAIWTRTPVTPDSRTPDRRSSWSPLARYPGFGDGYYPRGHGAAAVGAAAAAGAYYGGYCGNYGCHYDHYGRYVSPQQYPHQY